MRYHVADVAVHYASGDYKVETIHSKAIGSARAIRAILRRAIAGHGGCCGASIIAIHSYTR